MCATFLIHIIKCLKMRSNTESVSWIYNSVLTYLNWKRSQNNSESNGIIARLNIHKVNIWSSPKRYTGFSTKFLPVKVRWGLVPPTSHLFILIISSSHIGNTSPSHKSYLIKRIKFITFWLFFFFNFLLHGRGWTNHCKGSMKTRNWGLRVDIKNCEK